jgi:hypothetical protein
MSYKVTRDQEDCPRITLTDESPLVLLRDGEACMKRSGILAVDELTGLIGGACDLQIAQSVYGGGHE